MLASGGDDALVLYWDLINAGTSATLNNVSETGIGIAEGTGAKVKGPAASWRSDLEVGNISWSPPTQASNQGGEWLGVTGGRAIWGVKV